MKKFLIASAALGSVMVMSQTAQAGDVSVSVSADYVSEYVFRGVSFANTAIQPGISLSKGGFTVGTWVSAAIGETSALASDEIDVYASYGWNLTDDLSASVGATIYHFPQTDGGLFDFGGSSSLEAYFGLSYNTVLSPSVTAYYDFNLDTFTLAGSVSHTVPVADKTNLNLGLTAGLVAVDGGSASDYEWATASASFGYNVTSSSSVYVGANYSLNSKDFLDFPTINDVIPDDDLFWFGTGLSTSF